MKTIKFKEEVLTGCTSKYENGRNAYYLLSEDGAPYSVLSVNVPERSLPAGYFWAKNWSENEELYKEFIKLGLIEETGKVQPSGYVLIPECLLTEKGEEFFRGEE